MCDECRANAEGMVRSAQGMKDQPLPAFAQGLYRPPSAVIQKNGFQYGRLPQATLFAHANGRHPDEIKASGGLDPAFSSEICYSGDSGPGHTRWYDRLIFAARANAEHKLTKVAQLQGYGTDEKGKGNVYNYEFEAPQGTTYRSTGAKTSGEVCFPETIPWKWIVRVDEVTRQKKGNLTYTNVYIRPVT